MFLVLPMCTLWLPSVGQFSPSAKGASRSLILGVTENGQHCVEGRLALHFLAIFLAGACLQAQIEKGKVLGIVGRKATLQVQLLGR